MQSTQVCQQMTGIRQDATTTIPCSADAHLLLELMDDELGCLAVATGPMAPTSYNFDLDGISHMAVQSDGSVTLFGIDACEAGTIAAPWGLDAHMQPVATRYSVSGSVITLHVEHQGATYPVIADPCFSPYTGAQFDTETVTLHLSR